MEMGENLGFGQLEREREREIGQLEREREHDGEKRALFSHGLLLGLELGLLHF